MTNRAQNLLGTLADGIKRITINCPERRNSVDHAKLVPVVTNRPGWCTREEILERYAAPTGFNPTNITFYKVFAVFKLTGFCHRSFSGTIAGRRTTHASRRSTSA